MDKKIRAAAGHDAHGYNDNEWQKMEAMLEIHLPVKKERRRFLLLLSFLLLATSAFFVTKYFVAGNKPVAEQKTVSPTQHPAPRQNAASSRPAGSDKKTTGSPQSKPAKTNTASVNIQEAIHTYTHDQHIKPAVLPLPRSFTVVGTKGKAARKQSEGSANDRLTVASAINETVSKKIAEPQIAKETEVKKKEKDFTAATSALSTTGETASPVVTNQPTDSLTAAASPISGKKKLPKKSTGKISLTFSAGPDLSSVGFQKAGKSQVQYGLGFSYAVSQRISIRTGFYGGRKIYSADSTNYKSAYNSGPYSYKLHNIAANCYVYEIPVTVFYSFAPSKKHNWFASTGLSSYLMKKETYVYNYLDLWGRQMSYTHVHYNENSHFFSVLNLSGGYQYHFNDRLSILAEPYVKLPLSGIGAGKVKLNGTGVLFTLAVKPFGK